MPRPKLDAMRDIMRTARGQAAYARFMEEVAGARRATGRGPEKQRAGGRSERLPALSDRRGSQPW